MKKKITLIGTMIVLALVCAMFLTACGPASDPDKAKENLNDEGYSAAVYDGDNVIVRVALAAADVSNVDKVLIASKYSDDSFEFLSVLYFGSAKDANAAVEKAKEYAKNQQKEQEEEQKKTDGEIEWTFGKSGKMIWFGTKAAVKAAR